MSEVRCPFTNKQLPFGFLITFRTYGTWLHGDARGSVDRFHNRFGSELIPANERWRKFNLHKLSQRPVRLNVRQRAAVDLAIRESCKIRGWDRWAINVRTNHVHAVVSALCNPERILIAFKANATRKLREEGLWYRLGSPWAEKGSKRYLWTERALINAVTYVDYAQGE
jgi:REP element-mobilizing transposase RayT